MRQLFPFRWPPTSSCISFTIRRVLYMAALTARHHNPVIRAFAERLKAAGKPFKVVMTACMRKLLVILNAMVLAGTPWSLLP